VNRGKKGVILYSEVVTGHQPYTIGAIASEKETVEKLGSELEEKEKDNKIDSKAPNYYYLIIEEARKMEL
jgi:hemerythrin superfamily protein